MELPITYTGGGIKCDAEDCDYTDDTANHTNYHEWLNKPCPCCGSNLLTQEDYDAVKAIHELIDYINSNQSLVAAANASKDLNKASVKVSFNGSGIPTFDIEEGFQLGV